MTNDAPRTIWAVIYPHHSGKGPPVVNASASATNGQEYIRADIAQAEKDAAVAAAYEDAAELFPEAWAAARQEIRERANTDPLEAVRQKAKVEALREAAEYCETHTMASVTNPKYTQFAGCYVAGEAYLHTLHQGMGYAEAILALIPDTDKGGE
jgi:hypothetical protein